jgi:hypothetical protein
MLAVIEDQEHVTLAEEELQRDGDWYVGLLANPKRSCDGRWHQSWIGEGCELDEPHAVRVASLYAGSYLKREARLANAAGACECHEPVVSQPGSHIGKLSLASDEAGELGGKVVTARHGRACYAPRTPRIILELSGVRDAPHASDKNTRLRIAMALDRAQDLRRLVHALPPSESIEWEIGALELGDAHHVETGIDEDGLQTLQRHSPFWREHHPS